MPVSVLVDLYGDLNPPAVSVAVSGLPVDAERVFIYREAPNAARRIVRGGFDVTPTSDALFVVDLEAELGRPLVYVAEVYRAGIDTPEQTSSAALTVPDPGRHVLSDSFTGRPVLVDLIATPDEREQTVPSSTLTANGRRRPIALYDVRSDDRLELVVHTRDRAETLELEALLATGAPVVSRHPYDGCDVAGLEVLFVPRATRARRRRDGSRVWSLDAVAVDTPDPRYAVVLLTLQDLADFYVGRTLNDVSLDHATLLDLARSDYGTSS